MATYKIIRFRLNGPSDTRETGLTLEEAQAHCRREDTHGPGWFDGYDEEVGTTAVMICSNDSFLEA